MDFETARDEIMALVVNHWDAKTEELLGQSVELLFEEVGDVEPRFHKVPWGRLTIRMENGQQRSMGSKGNRRFERTGTVFLQMFMPKSQGVTLADKLSKIAVDSLEGNSTPGGVWFRNVGIRELGPEGPWLRTNMVADFLYDEVK